MLRSTIYTWNGGWGGPGRSLRILAGLLLLSVGVVILIWPWLIMWIFAVMLISSGMGMIFSAIMTPPSSSTPARGPRDFDVAFRTDGAEPPRD